MQACLIIRLMVSGIAREPGIYVIVNTHNQQKYVGQSENVRKRLYQHFFDLEHNTHYNRKLQAAFNKYRQYCFEFDVLGYYSKDDLNRAEQYWIDQLKPEYNTVLNIGGA